MLRVTHNKAKLLVENRKRYEKMNKKMYTGVRILLGLILLGSGIGVLAGFEPPYEGETARVLNALFDTGYLMQCVAVVKVVCGLALLSNRFVKLALVVFMPVSLNMVLFHVFLEFETGIGGYMIFLLNLILLFMHAKDYRTLLSMK